LQRRLATAGFESAESEAGSFDRSTSDAVRSFQVARGLHASAVCDEATWFALVEASWELGDRLLKLSAPHLRGDDVDELQVSLARLGFDCGRPDGIYGPATARAVQTFQRNVGITSDGICGSDTVRALRINSRQTGDGPGVAALRELVRLSAVVTDSTDLRLVVGQFGGLSSLSRQVARSLRLRGANVVSTDEPDATAQAAVANRHGATAYIGFEASSDQQSSVSYFAVPSFESLGGRSLAERFAVRFDRDPMIPIAGQLRGMRLPVLRETRMPAVLCSFWPIKPALTAAPAISSAVVESVLEWASAPLSLT
jgi:N-acetylmuramoyl-L-alanine amidase